MSVFSDKLAHYIKKSGMTILHLSEISGFEASHITKFKTGKRKPVNKEKFHRLIDGLCLSPYERRDLLNAYEVDQIGEFLYRQHMAVQRLLESTEQLPRIPAGNLLEPELDTVSAVYGSIDINRVVKTVLEHEMGKADGYIKIAAGLEYSFLLEQLSFPEQEDQAIPITHLICLQAAGSSKEADLYNIENIRQQIPVILSRSRYNPRYYYESSPIEAHNAAFMPYLIITSRYTMLISEDIDYAVLLQNPEIHEVYSQLFEKKLIQSASLLTQVSSPEDLMSVYQHIEADSGKIMYYFASAPATLWLLEEAEMEAILKPRLEHGEHVRKFLKYVKEQVNGGRKIHMFFSMEGVQKFLEHGSTAEYPHRYFQPIPRALRRKLLERMLAYAGQEVCHLHIIKPEQMYIPANVAVSVYSSMNLAFTCFHPERKDVQFIINEQTVASATLKYFEYLKRGRYTCSDEAAVQQIKCLLETFT